MGYPRGFSTLNGTYRNKSLLPLLKDLSSLVLADLKKIRKAYEAYAIKKDQYRAECARIETVNQNIERQNQQANERKARWNNEHIAPTEAELDRINKALRSCRAGLIGALFSDYIEYQGARYKHDPGTMLARQHQAILEKRGSLLQSKPDFGISYRKASPKQPRTVTKLKVGGATLRINLDELDIDAVTALINRHEEKRENQNSRLIELQARAAASEKETRQQAQKFRRDLHQQLAKVPDCPYCSGPLDDGNAHLDHIYPVSKGGQSTKKNLVFVCAKCNMGKRNFTLRTFILEFGMNEKNVHERLEILKKDF